MRILVTGGCGFIGSNFLNLFVREHPDFEFLNLDALTYAGNPQSLEVRDLPNHHLVRMDLAEADEVMRLVKDFAPHQVAHFAAESHVDRSILGPAAFIRANVQGTLHLLEACRAAWDGDLDGRVFHHVSTDEVYGELGEQGAFSEESPYQPNSPYSASKAASDHLVRAWGKTYGMPVKVTNCSNNYGPYQFPEKLIPLMIQNALEDKPLPVYGKGKNVRDWLFVEDHARAIWEVMNRGRLGETYLIGGASERRNIDVVRAIAHAVAEETGADPQVKLDLITYVTDRPGHDFRYAIDHSKITNELGWRPTVAFEEGLRQTVRWQIGRQEWVRDVQSGSYREWIDANYGARL
jgi:dTDP-glucose 4,6-dehydratase